MLQYIKFGIVIYLNLTHPWLILNTKIKYIIKLTILLFIILINSLTLECENKLYYIMKFIKICSEHQRLTSKRKRNSSPGTITLWIINDYKKR